ncbi:hypothetical protein FHT77_000976 [Rhizobium sp. BK181]|uniref:SAM-dependent methyltransferase n=1 Tax=Rhizobium sp. BK181 TaxID=2587072 RepID=UPI001610C13B|nr:SAM-dependent methyltransferase [Rhizobium sp. BK181]MBB3315134.1 hypothetical protein [Rhizobium sp. BK181]
MKLSDKANEMLRKAVADGVIDCPEERDVASARRLNGRQLLSRDPKVGTRFYPTEKTREYVALLDEFDEPEAAVEAHANAVISIVNADASGLVQVVDRARTLLDEGDAVAARILASGAYDQAKAGAQFAARVGAKDRLVQKARRLQAEALLIEARAKILLAQEWDRAVADGKTLKGRPKSVPDENAFTAEEAGLTRKEIHEARRLAEAERKAPGLVERAIQARVDAGLEPSRANLKAAVGTATATKEERGHNLYETPPEAMHTLLALEAFTATVWEPSCGKGAIARMLEAASYGVVLSDLVDYGTADSFGEVQRQVDFLTTEGDPEGASSFDIVTNPPYGQVLNSYVAHALRIHKPRKMALLLNLNFVCGFDDEDRNFAMDDNPPARIYVFTRRLPMMHRDGWDGPEASSRMNTAWFVWELQEDGTYGNQHPDLVRVDWKKFQPAESEVS